MTVFSTMQDIIDSGKKYDLIYLDPPWEYQDKQGSVNLRGAATAHYDVMPLDKLKEMPFKRDCSEKLRYAHVGDRSTNARRTRINGSMGI